MGAGWKTGTWKQFGAAIDMLENACAPARRAVARSLAATEFWYLVYHTLFFLDFHLSDSEVGFAPPPLHA